MASRSPRRAEWAASGSQGATNPLHALLVHNPSAGTGHHDKDMIVDALELANIKADYVSSKDDDLKRALKKTYDLVVAAGGDGTIAYVFSHLSDRSIPIGILPLGSANNIARSLGVAGTVAELAEYWRAGEIRPFHLLEVAEEDEKPLLCAEGFGVGLTAALVLRRAKGKKADGADDIRRGRRAFRAVLKEAKPLDLEIKVDGKPMRDDLLSFDVLNIRFVGPALPLAKDADPSGETLAVAGFASNHRDKLDKWIKSPQQGTPPGMFISGKRIEISWRGVPVRFDSDVVDAKSDWRHARLRRDPEALHILTAAEPR